MSLSKNSCLAAVLVIVVGGLLPGVTAVGGIGISRLFPTLLTRHLSTSLLYILVTWPCLDPTLVTPSVLPVLAPSLIVVEKER